MPILAAEAASALPDKSLCVLHKRERGAGTRVVTRAATLGAHANLFARGFRSDEEFLGLLEGLRAILETF